MVAATNPAASVPGGPPGITDASPALMPLQRLSRVEYENTIHDLLGPSANVRVVLPQEPVGPSSYTFASEIGGVERDLLEQGANNAVDGASAATIPPCASAANERTCASDFVQSFGKKAFRRPLLDTESMPLLALYDTLKGAPTSFAHADAIKMLIVAILQAPQFLYHWELGSQKPMVQAGVVTLNGWEIASRLSYLFWGTMPDTALLQAAESHGLDTPAGIEAQARRLLMDKGRAAYFATNMFGQWIGMSKLEGLSKDKAVIASFSDAIKGAMQGETERFLAKTVLEDGTWKALLTSRDSFVNGPLAPLYGIKGITGDPFTPQTLPAERAGLFTRSAFLAIKALPQEGSPVHRGKVISTRLLCNHIDPPPPTLMVTPPPDEPGKTNRQRYDVHGKTPGCASCHNQMDPYGFAFENFDAVGQYRTMDAGQLVDASGTLPDLDGKSVTFKNAAELMGLLANSPRAQACAASQFMLIGLGRPLVTKDKSPLDGVAKVFQSSGDLRELAIAFVKSDSFRFRAPADNEVTQ